MLIVLAAVTYPAECTQDQFFLRLRIVTNSEPLNSCKDTDTAQSEASRREEATMASIWQAMVCWMHYAHNWKLDQSRHK
jgi:hypothetical protein